MGEWGVGIKKPFLPWEKGIPRNRSSGLYLMNKYSFQASRHIITVLTAFVAKGSKVKRFTLIGRSVGICMTFGLVLLTVLATGCARTQPVINPQTATSFGHVHSQLDALYNKGKYKEGIELARSALESVQKDQLANPWEAIQLLNYRCTFHIATGDYEGAEIAIKQGMALGKRALGDDHIAKANLLNNLGMVRLYRGDYTEAGELFEQAIQIAKNLVGSNSALTAVYLSNLGEAYVVRGRYKEAEDVLNQSIKIQETLNGTEHLNVSRALDKMGVLYMTTGRYKEAEDVYRRSLAIKEKVFGEKHVEIATTLNSLGSSYYHTHRFHEAEASYHRAETMLEHDHSLVAAIHANLANVYKSTGDFVRARESLQLALAKMTASLGAKHPDVATVLLNLATINVDLSDYQSAEAQVLRGLAIREEQFGHDHSEVASALRTVGDVYSNTRQPHKAIKAYERALAIQERALGKEHFEIAYTSKKLSNLYAAIDDKDHAYDFSMRSMKILMKSLKEGGLNKVHFEDATIILAERYTAVKDYDKAENLLLVGIGLRLERLGKEHPLVGETMYKLANVYIRAENYAKASNVFKKVLEIQEKAYGTTDLTVATTLDRLGEIHQETGDYRTAEGFFTRALRIREEKLGLQHPVVSKGLVPLAFLRMYEGKYASAIELYKKVLSEQDRYIAEVFRFTTETQKLDFIRSSKFSYDCMLSAISRFPHDTALLLEGIKAVIRRKGIVYDAVSLQQDRFKNNLSPSSKELWNQLQNARKDLAQLYFSRQRIISAESFHARSVALRQAVEDIERKLITDDVTSADTISRELPHVQEIASAMPTGSILIEFIKIWSCQPNNNEIPSSRYLAFILHSSRKVSLVDLGDSQQIESLVEQTLSLIKIELHQRNKTSIANTLRSLQQLHSRVWAHFEPHVKGASKIFLSPDGLLNLVPFAALVTPDGQYLVEQHRLTYLSSTKDLIKRPTYIKPEIDLVLIANPAYDYHPSLTTKDKTTRTREWNVTFNPLPGTEREAREIPPLVSASKSKTRVLMGKEATERAIKQIKSPGILHLATHGFFLENRISEKEVDVRGIGIVASGSPEDTKQTAPIAYANPLIRSGLALAGANRISEGVTEDDGILTALEVSGMDLQGTYLVVLSACESALGELRTGEGVFGLRRAFSMAGARNVLMSLWSVDDESTAEQMKTFYKNLQSMEPADALRHSQLATLRKLRDRKEALSTAIWAPFILQGAHRPL